MSNQEPVLDGRRSVTAAALARQALELAVDRWLTAHGALPGTRQRDAFLCLAALHPDPALARLLHDTWARLSTACHAISYELPPIASELERWITVIRRFVDEAGVPAAPRAQRSGGDQSQTPGGLSSVREA